MDRQAVKKYCMALPATIEKDVGAPANVLTYSIGGKKGDGKNAKKFAYFKTSNPEKWRLSIRVTPERFLELTDQPGIKPARYMHRFHWVSIVKVDSIDGDYLKELIDWSYQKAFASLTRTQQREVSDRH